LFQIGVDVQPAKGGMFNSLEDVARHLQNIGAKLDIPNDPKMAELLGQFGVLNKPKGKIMISYCFIRLYSLF
jgi:hypothetical protein